MCAIIMKTIPLLLLMHFSFLKHVGVLPCTSLSLVSLNNGDIRSPWRHPGCDHDTSSLRNSSHILLSFFACTAPRGCDYSTHNDGNRFKAFNLISSASFHVLVVFLMTLVKSWFNCGHWMHFREANVFIRILEHVVNNWTWHSAVKWLPKNARAEGERAVEELGRCSVRISA